MCNFALAYYRNKLHRELSFTTLVGGETLSNILVHLPCIEIYRGDSYIKNEYVNLLQQMLIGKYFYGAGGTSGT
jgi:hypothetical protein